MCTCARLAGPLLNQLGPWSALKLPAHVGGQSRQLHQARRALHAKLLRSCVLAGAVVAYVGGRRWLAGDDLVRIYRKVPAPPLFHELAQLCHVLVSLLHPASAVSTSRVGGLICVHCLTKQLRL